MRADGDEVVSTTLTRSNRHVHNLERDGHLAVSIRTGHFNEHGLQEYLVVSDPTTASRSAQPA